MFEQRVQRTFDAASDHDLAAVMRGWAEDGVLEFPGQTPISGRHEGRPAIEAFFRAWFARMATIHVTVRSVGFSGPRMTYGGTMYVELETDQVTTEGVPLHTTAVGVFRFRRGKAVFYREYLLDLAQTEAVWGRAAG